MAKLIAELASSHNGDLDLLKALVKAAARSGADIVKVQDWRASNVPDSDPDKARYEKYQFKDEWWPFFIAYCEQYGVEPLTSCFNKDRVEFLAAQGLKKIKIASVCLTNTDLLMWAGAHFDEVILSTAMATEAQIEEAADVLATNAKKFVLLACTANYPCLSTDTNLLRMNSLKDLVSGQEYASVGYSSHSLDLDVPKLAIGMGAKYVEVHFSLARELPQTPHQMYEGGPQTTTHAVSLVPHELRQLSEWRDKVVVMRGSGKYSINETEWKIRERYAGRYGV